MSAALGSLLFHGLIGPPPRLPQLGVGLFTRPGTSGTGARIMPAVGVESTIDLVRFNPAAIRVSTVLDYRLAIGSIVTFEHDGESWNTTYGYNFLVLDVSIKEAVTIPRAVGAGILGGTYDYAPACRIVSHWTLTAVPA